MEQLFLLHQSPKQRLCSPAWVLQVLGMAPELLALNVFSFLFL